MLKFLRTFAIAVAMLLPFAAGAQETFDFEDNAIPGDWTNNSANPWVVTSTSQGSGHSGTYCIKSGNSGIASSVSEISATFDFADDGSISFLGGIFGEGSSTAWDKCIFEIDNVQQFAYGALGTWATYTYQIAAGTHTFTWKYSKDSSVNPTGDAFFVDDIVVDLGAVPTCIKPSNLTVSDLTAHEATFSWESEVGNYVFEYKPAAASDEEWEVISTSDNTVTIDGLTQNTAYTARVKAICDADDESAYRTINFTTTVSCPAPTALTVTLTPGNGTVATLSWEQTGGMTAWQLCLDNNEEELIDVDENPYTLTDLTPEQTYTAKVRAVGDDEFSSWSNTVTFTPTNAYNITVGDGTSTTYVTPYNSLWGYSFVEQIFLADEIDIVGNITSIAFNMQSTESQTNQIEVFMKNVTRETFTSETDYEPVTAGDMVFTGTVTFNPGMTTIEFDEPFAYDGGNLLIAVHEYTSGYSTRYFYYTEATDKVLTYHSDSANPDPYNLDSYSGNKYTSANRSNIQLEYIPVGDDYCYKPANLTISDLTAHEATFTWEGEADNYVFEYKKATDVEWTVEELSEMTITLTDLTAETAYNARVKAVCGDDNESSYRTMNFTTQISCPAVTAAHTTAVTAHGATIEWTAGGQEEAWWVVVDNDYENGELVEENTFEVDGLLPTTSHNVKIRAYCGEEDTSTVVTVNFTTLVSCPAVTNAHVSEITPNSATIEWTIGSEEEAWMVYVDGDEDGVMVEEPTFELTDLEPSTAHTVVIKAYCGEEDLSTAVTVNCTTLVACPAPAGLAATLTPGNGTIATLSWNAQGATAWQICLNNDMENLIDVTETASYDLTDLTAEQTYTAKVRTVCSDEETSEWSNTISFTPTNSYTVTVADGTATNSYVPVYGLWCDDYVKSHFVYPADNLEVINGGMITSLTFYISSPAGSAWTGSFKVYLGEVDGTTISAYANVEELTQVYDGQLDGTGATMTIEFEEEYLYGGGNLLVAVEEYVTGSWSSCYFYGITANGASIYGYSSSSLASVSATQANFLPKTTINYIPGSGEFCEKPSSIAVSDITAHEATVTWESEVGNYILQYKESDLETWTEIADITDNTYTLTTLNQNTTYNVRVAAVCGEESVSAWRNASSFTTPVLFPAPTNLTATTVQGNGTEATLSWTENGEAEAWQICLDNDMENLIDADENPFTLTDLIPEHIYTAKVRSLVDGDNSSWSTPVTFQPSNKLVVGSGEATNSYLPTYSFYNNALTEQIYTVEELGEAAFFESIDFYNGGDEKTRNIDIYMVSTDKTSFTSGSDWVAVTESDRVFSGNVTFTANTWTTIEFSESFIYDGTNNVILAVDDNTGSYSSGLACRVFNATDQAIYVYSDPTDYDPTAPAYSGYVATVKNQIRLLTSPLEGCIKPTALAVSEIGPNSVELSWTDNAGADSWVVAYKTATDEEFTEVEVATNPFTLEDLTPETGYTVKVRSVCDDEDISWSSLRNFTTTELCPDPINLTVTNITASTATLSWTAFSDSYNVRYRRLPTGGQDFENGIGAWTNIDADGDGLVWVLASASAGVYHNSGVDLTGQGHNGSDDFIVSGSYSNASGEALTPDNYLVSPQVQLGGSISFWASAQDVNYAADHFGVAVSTTGNTDPEDFTTIAEWTMTADGTGIPGAKEASPWGQFTVDLSDYEGMGYVAIRHFNCTDMFILNVDDINIETPGDAEDNPWIEVTTTTTSVSISGLQPNTFYEWQVQNICQGEEDDWTSSNIFTTNDGESCNNPTNLAAEATENSITITYGGDAENYEVAIVEGSTWTAPAQGTAVSAQTYTFSNLTPATAYTVGVRAICSEELASGWVYVTVTTIDAACEPVTGVTVSDVTMTGATVAWTVADEAQTAWEINVTGLNYDQTFTATTNPYTLTGLTADVEYTVKVRAACGGSSYSEWSDPATFTTSVCEAVSNVLVSNITTSSATVEWTAPEGQTTWQLDYGNQGHPQGTGTMVVVNTNPYTLTNLSEYTPYDVYVRAICEDGVFSEWSLKASFTTLEDGEGIDGVNSDLINLYPNPASSTVTISGISGEATVSVVDMNGRTVYTEKANETLTIDLNGYAQGAYFVRISGEQTMAIRKLIVK